MDRNGNFVKNILRSIGTIKELKMHGVREQSSWEAMIGN